MSTDRDNARRQIERLIEALGRDIDAMSDEEILAEAADLYGSTEKAATDTLTIIGAVIAASGKQRLAAARKGYDTHVAGSRPNVVKLPLERKLVLIERFAGNDNDVGQKLTLAARNGEAVEADIDSFLEDLIELGLIDEEGNAP